jgi:hypothetical protein
MLPRELWMTGRWKLLTFAADLGTAACLALLTIGPISAPG